MTKFKIGDKVRYIHEDQFVPIGTLGEVYGVEEDCSDVEVHFTTRRGCTTQWYELELVESKSDSGAERDTIDIEVFVEKKITLRLLDQTFDINEDETRDIINKLKKALGEE